MADNTIRVAVILEGELSDAVAEAIRDTVRQEVDRLLETPRQRALKRRAWRRTRRFVIPAIPEGGFGDIADLPGVWKIPEGQTMTIGGVWDCRSRATGAAE